MCVCLYAEYHRSSGCTSNEDDDKHGDSGHPCRHKYHRNMLCISSSAWITIIVAPLALQVVSNVPIDFSIRSKDRMMMMITAMMMMMITLRKIMKSVIVASLQG